MVACRINLASPKLQASSNQTLAIELQELPLSFTVGSLPVDATKQAWAAEIVCAPMSWLLWKAWFATYPHIGINRGSFVVKGICSNAIGDGDFSARLKTSLSLPVRNLSLRIPIEHRATLPIDRSNLRATSYPLRRHIVLPRAQFRFASGRYFTPRLPLGC